MDRLRILHVIFSSNLAGSERYCVDLANRQAESGLEVHVAGMRHAPVLAELDPQVRFHGRTAPIFRQFWLPRLAAALGADVCHAHLSAACKAMRRMSDVCPTVATLHVGYKSHQHAWINGLICVNHSQAGRLASYGGLVRVIPNWKPFIRATTDSAGIRKELGLDRDTFLIGAVGRLHSSKGMDILINAFRAGAPARSALVILGQGPQRRELECLRANDTRIHLLGHRREAAQLATDFDLFVSPSREESFGLAILEAMSAGIPIIATAADGPRELLRDQPAVLVAPGSCAALAAAIRAAHERIAAGNMPRPVAYDLRSFEPANRLADIDDFYAQVIAAHERRPAEEGLVMAVAT